MSEIWACAAYLVKKNDIRVCRLPIFVGNGTREEVLGRFMVDVMDRNPEFFIANTETMKLDKEILREMLQEDTNE